MALIFFAMIIGNFKDSALSKLIDQLQLCWSAQSFENDKVDVKQNLERNLFCSLLILCHEPISNWLVMEMSI